MIYADFVRYAESINGVQYTTGRSGHLGNMRRAYTIERNPIMAMAKGMAQGLNLQRQILEEARKTKIGLIKYDGDISASSIIDL